MYFLFHIWNQEKCNQLTFSINKWESKYFFLWLSLEGVVKKCLICMSMMCGIRCGYILVVYDSWNLEF